MADDRMKHDDQQRNMGAGGQDKGVGQQSPGRGGQGGRQGQQRASMGRSANGQQGQQGGGKKDRKAWKTTTNSPLAVRDSPVDRIVAVRTARS